jgi:predicted DNA-binding protein (UPF0251 family)
MVPRPRMFRRVLHQPGVTHFKPVGVRMRSLHETVLTVEEFESIRLKDYEDMDQTRAAKKMGISQPTFQRLYESARKKLAEALVNGKAIRIKGGHFRLISHHRRVMHHHVRGHRMTE